MWKVDKYRRWTERLTVKQYALFTGALNFAILTLVFGAMALILPRSWLPDRLAFTLFMVPFMTVWMTAFLVWLRRDALRQEREHPAGKGDQFGSSPS
jgi:hypothetical protein